jgi:hypothetical protein
MGRELGGYQRHRSEESHPNNCFFETLSPSPPLVHHVESHEEKESGCEAHDSLSEVQDGGCVRHRANRICLDATECKGHNRGPLQSRITIKFVLCPTNQQVSQ